MKRLALWFLALSLLLPVAAEGKVMVARVRGNGAGEAVRLIDSVPNQSRAWAILCNLMDLCGVEWVVPGVNETKTEFMRTGAQTWNLNTTGARLEQFDAAVTMDPNSSASSQYVGGYVPDSMTFKGNTKPPTVPQLFLTSNYFAWAGPATGAFRTAANCSTGVAALTNSFNDQWYRPFYATGGGDDFFTGSYTAGYERDVASPAGGVRTFLTGHCANLYLSNTYNGVNCAWCDSSLGAGAGTDTLLMWERTMSHIHNAKPIVFAVASGAGGLYDSTQSVIPPTENDPMVMLAGLARLDSLTGGKVFTLGKLPIKSTGFIRGGFSRSGLRHFIGTYGPDSSVLKGSIDSCAARHLTGWMLACKTDSIASYPNELAWWSRWTELRYCAYLDIDGCVGAYGPLGGTSVYAKAVAALAAGRAAFGSRWSNFVVPANDDWIPSTAMTNASDSVLWALNKAGATGLLNAANSQNGWAAMHPSNLAAGFRGQGMQHALGIDFKVLAHPGYMVTGGSVQAFYVHNTSGSARVDTTWATFSAAGFGVDNDRFEVVVHEVQRFWSALLPTDRCYDQFKYDPQDYNATSAGVNVHNDDYHDYVRRASCIVIGPNDLSGNPLGPPARNGWWLIKNLDNQFKFLNRLDGKPVMTWAYPEDVQP